MKKSLEILGISKEIRVTNRKVIMSYIVKMENVLLDIFAKEKNRIDELFDVCEAFKTLILFYNINHKDVFFGFWEWIISLPQRVEPIFSEENLKDLLEYISFISNRLKPKEEKQILRKQRKKIS